MATLEKPSAAPIARTAAKLGCSADGVASGLADVALYTELCLPGAGGARKA